MAFQTVGTPVGTLKPLTDKEKPFGVPCSEKVCVYGKCSYRSKV